MPKTQRYTYTWPYEYLGENTTILCLQDDKVDNFLVGNVDILQSSQKEADRLVYCRAQTAVWSIGVWWSVGGANFNSISFIPNRRVGVVLRYISPFLLFVANHRVDEIKKIDR